VYANHYLEQMIAFAWGALQAGIGYSMLINRIVKIARERWAPTPFLKELQKNRAGRAKIRRRAAKLAQSYKTASLKDNKKVSQEKPVK